MPVDLYSAISDRSVSQIAKAMDWPSWRMRPGLWQHGVWPACWLHADVATFSFFGNKTVTTGEGGAVISNDDALAARMRKVKGQGQSLTRRYWHDEIGFNYRMTNICAAIGLAQIEISTKFSIASAGLLPPTARRSPIPAFNSRYP